MLVAFPQRLVRTTCSCHCRHYLSVLGAARRNVPAINRRTGRVFVTEKTIANAPERDSGAVFSTVASGCAALVALAASVWFALQIERVAAGGAREYITQWVPSLGVTLNFRLDGLALMFSLLISVIGLLVVLYTASYFRQHPDRGRLQLLLLAFMLSMLGLVSADNVILLFVFWELTTVTSFLLVGFDHKNEQARRSALQALLVTAGGGLALLLGLIILAQMAGTYQLSAMIASDVSLTTHPHYPVALLLILLGAFTKSAQFPFHFWLPNAMAAPSPVSAYLHSATMVKAGIYLLMRFQPALGGTDWWFYTLTIFGAITAVWASLMALRQTDIKLMLAWTTVMALGTLTMFLGSDLRIAALAAVTFLLVHAFYKCALFLVIGNVDKRTGTRELPLLGGLFRSMPITGFIAVAAGLSMAGFPPFLGFIGKELKYEGALAIAEEPWLIVVAAVAANAMMVGIALTIIFKVFLSGKLQTDRRPSEVPLAMWFGPLLLAIAGLSTGVFPELIAPGLIEPAISNVLATPTDVKLSLWHGINVPLMLSVVTVILGCLVFWKLPAIKDLLDRWAQRLPSGDGIYQTALRAIDQAATFVTERLQTGSLSHYLTIVMAVLLLAVGSALLVYGINFDITGLTPVPVLAAVVVALMMAASLVVAVSGSRLLSICALGVIGSGVALLFLIFGAIDVAITQLMVETLFVVLIAAVLLRLPRFPGEAHPGRGGNLRDAVISVGVGVVFGVLTFGVAMTQPDLAITEFFAENSLTKAYGRNIVNVILVDFRALDTFGEVAVVATAAMAVVALLKVRSADKEASS